MSHYIKWLFVLSFLAATSGCAHIYGDNGVIKNRDTDYLHAKNIPPLRIPPGYSSGSIQATYPVSEREYPQTRKPVDLTPPGLNNSGK